MTTSARPRTPPFTVLVPVPAVCTLTVLSTLGDACRVGKATVELDDDLNAKRDLATAGATPGHGRIVGGGRVVRVGRCGIVQAGLEVADRLGEIRIRLDGRLVAVIVWGSLTRVK